MTPAEVNAAVIAALLAGDWAALEVLVPRVPVPDPDDLGAVDYSSSDASICDGVGAVTSADNDAS